MDIQPKSEVAGRGLCPVCKVDREFIVKPRRSGYPSCKECGARFLQIPESAQTTETKS